MHCIGIEIGGTKLQLVAGTPDGRILDRHRASVDASAGGEGIRRAISSALPGLVRQWAATRIGIGFGGPVDHASGVICCSHQVRGWHDFPLGQWLHEVTRLPVRVDNDANVAALGEARCGAGREANPVFWINMGSGVGGGLVVDGHIYHGRKPGEMEVGHLRIDREGHTLEDQCSGWAVDRRIREVVVRHPHGTLARLCKGFGSGEARQLSPALAAGDPQALEILESVAADIAYALGHVTQLLNPEVIVIGGGLSLVGEPLRAAIEKFLAGEVMAALRPGPRVFLAGLGEDSVPVGALILAGARG